MEKLERSERNLHFSSVQRVRKMLTKRLEKENNSEKIEDLIFLTFGTEPFKFFKKLIMHCLKWKSCITYTLFALIIANYFFFDLF